MKVLVVRFSSIGDIVLTTPVVRGLKTQLGDCEVHYATKKQFGSIFTANPYLDKIHLWDQNSSFDAFLKTLKSENFDYVIDLHNSIKSMKLKRALKSKSYSFSKLNIEKWLLVNFKLNRMPNRHIVDRYMDTVQQLGVKEDALGLDYFIPEHDEVALEWLPETHRGGYYALAIGAQHATKRLPEKRLIELCDRINKPIVLLGGKEDAVIGDNIARFFEKEIGQSKKEDQLQYELNKKAIVFNGCGKFNLNQSASLLKQSLGVFTHDTGLMHIAAAFKKRIFSIWGNTVPEFGMYPYKTQFSIFENKKLPCRPCSKIGHDNCPLGHFKCMNDVVFDFYLP
jgi:ADP-heptose:LPS heptosyltransferase